MHHAGGTDKAQGSARTADSGIDFAVFRHAVAYGDVADTFTGEGQGFTEGIAQEMFDFAYDDTYKKGFQSIFQLPNPYFTVSANSVSNASVSTGGFNPDAVRYYPPYLEIKTGAVTMEAGTHIFMEVCN